MSQSKHSFAHFFKQIAYAGVKRSEYESTRPYLYAKNYHLLTHMTLIGSLIMLGLMLAALFINEIKVFLPAYAALFGILLAILVLNKTLAAKNNSLSMPLFYMALTAAYAFGIAIGTVLQPDMPATAFPVLLFALPLLLTDKPYHCNILLVSATAAFCICSYIFKPGNIFELDVINNISFCIFSILCNQVVMKVKLNDLKKRCYIEHERDTDGLTKLLNRSAGESKIMSYLEHSNAPSMLLMLDIDKFKAINDTSGHDVGDSALQLLSESIKETFRNFDALVRFGGDEFLVFIPYVNDKEFVTHKINELKRKISEHRQEFEFMPKINFSVGVASYPEDASSYEELLKKADDALYFSKYSDCRVSYYSECFEAKQQSL